MSKKNLENRNGNIKIACCGDRALTVNFGNAIDGRINDTVQYFCRLMELESASSSWGEGVGEVVPCYCSALFSYRPEIIPFKRVLSIVTAIAEKAASARDAAGTAGSGAPDGDPSGPGDSSLRGSSRLLQIPCCYGGHFGPDLAPAEKLTGLSREEIIAIHSGTDYRVYMLGFLPGFVYLGGLDPRLELPRLKTPRVKIPRGSVGIGGKQTGVYPMDSPGGWQLLGATPVDFYDPAREEPILCRAGDTIRFVPISSCEYYDIRQEILKGGRGWR